MTRPVYLESEPLRLEPRVFRIHQYIVTNLANTPGIVIEDGCPELMFVRQRDIKLGVEGCSTVRVPGAFSGGRFTAPFKYQYDGEMNYFAVKMQPWVARHFFPADIVNGLVDLTAVFGPEIGQLRDEIFSESTFEKMIERAENFLLRIELPEPESYRLVMEICGRIYSSNGMVSIRDLVTEFAESRQKINREFLYHTKYRLKEFAVFVKIRAAIRFKAENPSVSLTDLAQEFGYFDQSHFNRDMKKAAGVTPTFLFANQNFIKDQLAKRGP